MEKYRWIDYALTDECTKTYQERTGEVLSVQTIEEIHSVFRRIKEMILRGEDVSPVMRALGATIE